MSSRWWLGAVVRGSLFIVACQLAGIPERASAQERSDSSRLIDPEFRLDAIVATVSALHAGAGLTVVTGTYLRSGIVAGLGFSRDALSGRIDALTRFHFDPLRQSRWAPYGGGGISARFDHGERPRALVLLVLGLDGPVGRGMTPAFELGLGGGARAGVSFRRATGERR